MIERREDPRPGLVHLLVREKVRVEDYREVVEPLFEEARREGRRIRLLVEFGEDFSSFTPGAAWRDLQVGRRYLRLLERCAVVADSSWVRGSALAAGAVTPVSLRTYERGQLEQAVEWLAAPLGSQPLAHRFDAERRVLVLELHERLTVEDFDAVASLLDPYLETGGELRGLVLHVRRFPGWENLAAFFRHIRFVRDHHRRIPRVALAADGTMARLAPALVEHFVAAKVERFPYDELARAEDWAGAEA